MGLPSGEVVAVPSSYDPFVIESSRALGYKITPDAAARIAAALTADERKEEEKRSAWSTITFITGNDDEPQPSEESRWDRGYDNRGVERVFLDMAASTTTLILNDWLDRLSSAIPYDPGTHGILRSPALPNGLRTAPDRLATLEEIAEHKKAVGLSQASTFRRWAEPVLRILRRLKT